MGNSDLDEIAAGGSPYGPIVLAVVLLTAPASISASATRLHDRGMPAWWLLLGLVPYVGGLALLVLNGFLRGDAGPNRYGHPGWAAVPHGPVAAAAGVPRRRRHRPPGRRSRRRPRRRTGAEPTDQRGPCGVSGVGRDSRPLSSSTVLVCCT